MLFVCDVQFRYRPMFFIQVGILRKYGDLVTHEHKNLQYF